MAVTNSSPTARRGSTCGRTSPMGRTPMARSRRRMRAGTARTSPDTAHSRCRSAPTPPLARARGGCSMWRGERTSGLSTFSSRTEPGPQAEGWTVAHGLGAPSSMIRWDSFPRVIFQTPQCLTTASELHQLFHRLGLASQLGSLLSCFRVLGPETEVAMRLSMVFVMCAVLGGGGVRV